jgi:L-lactate dehydrogenase
MFSFLKPLIFTKLTSFTRRQIINMSVEQIMSQVQPGVQNAGAKVTIVGAGQVGMACAFSILTQVTRNYELQFNLISNDFLL